MDAGTTHADAGPHITATTGTVARGQYLVDHVLACGTCHTPNDANGNPDMTKYLAGSRNYNFTDVDNTVVTVYAEKLTSGVTCGVQMPQGSDPITAAQLEMVHSWIADGAQNN